MVLHYSAETNIKVSKGRSVMHQKTQQVPEIEGSVDEPLSANGSQNWTLSKSRENEALTESKAATAWAKIHTLHFPYHIVFSPCLTRRLKLSGSEKLYGWPPSLRKLMPVSQKFSETPEDGWWRQSQSTLPNCSASPPARLPQSFWGPVRVSNICSQNLRRPRPAKAWWFTRVGRESFLSWSHFSVAVRPWGSNLHFTA